MARCGIAFGAIVLSFATLTAQDTPHLRALVSLYTPPAIDRGLRENDPPRPVNTDATTRLDRSGDRKLPYAPGGVIVKFRPGTSDAARQAIMGLIGGTRSPALSYSS